MKKNNQKDDVWIGGADKNNNPDLVAMTKKEFSGLPISKALGDENIIGELKSDRRDFLKYLGFGIGAATLAASCDAPVRRAIPYVTKPEEITPGVPTYYASSYVDKGDFVPILVKTREGRPIKIEGNPNSKMTGGGTNARAQAAVLSMYNKYRINDPSIISNGRLTKIDWTDVDQEVISRLEAANNIRIVTNTIISPATKSVFADFQAKYPSTKVVTYDAISYAGLLDANLNSFGERVIPNYRFDKADLIVTFGADFLGTWISPVEFTKQYSSRRRISDPKKANMNKLVAIESGMSLTGSNADNRILIRPSEQDAAIANLLAELGGGVSAPKINGKAASQIKKLATKLKANRGKSLVVSNSNNVGAQTLINKINDLLSNYGNTLDFGAVSYQRQGSDKAIQGLLSEMKSGSVDFLLFYDANPCYDLPNSAEFSAAMEKVTTKISLSSTIDETTSLCDVVVPKHHFLESWGDALPKKGVYGLIQPTIRPVFNTRQGEVTLMTWMKSSLVEKDQPFYNYLKTSWQNRFFGNAKLGFTSFWDRCLHDGGSFGTSEQVVLDYTGDHVAAMGIINKPSSSDLEFSLHEDLGIGAGQNAENPWLQEMPNPVTRTTWGNYLSVPIEWDGNSKFVGLNGTGKDTVYGLADILSVTLGELTEKFSTVPQFGQATGSISTNLGYGREEVGLSGKKIGLNVFPFLTFDKNGNTTYYNTNIQLSEILDQDDEFACVQYHHTMGVTSETENGKENLDEIAIATVGKGYQGSLVKRSVLYKGSMDHVDHMVEEIHEFRAEAADLNSKTLYPFAEYTDEKYSQGNYWAMHIDLSACTGCGSCTVACMAENNIPVVGKKEVSRHHEMAWLRIDRYFYGDAENPNVAYMPMMCQHCDNAPCENVCPVNATNHSSEGLNQMIYNRCIGTRYCANNCPFKVRRFNWLDYTSADSFKNNQQNDIGIDPHYYNDNITRLVLNPDVTVRVRGVIEKCSFCVQRLQSGKLTAKIENRSLNDSDVRSACQTACPAGAITFGDLNNKEGELNEKIKSPLVYRALEEINVQSSVFYQARMNNRSEDLEA